MGSLLIFSLGVCLALVVTSFAQVSVNVPGLGTVIGNTNTTVWTGKTYMQFRGIPYAQAPSGNLRFKAPVPHKPWLKPLQATAYGRACPQSFSILNVPADTPGADVEDCLTLNVFTKNLDANQPVMFFVHGGGFQVGSAPDYPPGFLLEQDVVLVVIQYRLNVFGFTGTKTPEMPGNTGLMDAMLAMEWVQRHISAFGGDGSQITVFGQSVGAVLSGALMVSPKTPPFQRIITQSGSVVDKRFVKQEPQVQVERLCRALQCSRCELVFEMEMCLKNASVSDITRVAIAESYGLIVGDFYGTLPQDPAQLVAATNRSIPIMSGFLKNDASGQVGRLYTSWKSSNINFDSVTVGEFATGLTSYLNDTTGLTNNAMTRLLFPLDLWKSFDHKRAIPAYFDLATTLNYRSPIIGFTNKLFDNSDTSPIYLYTFDYEGEQTNFGLIDLNYPFNGGVYHTDDLIYLFSTNQLNSADTEMAKKMVAMWTSFAMTGQPNASDGSLILPMETARGPYFHINQRIKMGDDVLKEFTAAINDPDNEKLDRPNIPF